MILYYSGVRGDLCNPAVILGDEASVMLSFFECDTVSGEPNSGFARLEEARKRKPKRYKAYRDYPTLRENETLYGAFDAEGQLWQGPTPLLTSLVCELKPLPGALIARYERDGSRTILYRSKGGQWKPTRKQGVS